MKKENAPSSREGRYLMLPEEKWERDMSTLSQLIYQFALDAAIGVLTPEMRPRKLNLAGVPREDIDVSVEMVVESEAQVVPYGLKADDVGLIVVRAPGYSPWYCLGVRDDFLKDPEKYLQLQHKEGLLYISLLRVTKEEVEKRKESNVVCKKIPISSFS